MNILHKRFLGLLYQAPLCCLIFVFSHTARGDQYADGKNIEQPGRWIPLPYFRNNTWWLPVDAEKPLAVQAKSISLIGTQCYLVQRGESSQVLMDQSGRELLTALRFWEIDARHFGFLTPGAVLKAGVVDDTGRVVIPPEFDETALAERIKKEPWYQAPGGQMAPQPATQISDSEWRVESNIQMSGTPTAMSYCRELGLLAVAGAGEMCVWDVRARCCMWRTSLESSADVSGIHLLPSGRIFVSAGMFKWAQMNYVAVYDLSSRTLTARHRPDVNRGPGHVRTAPLSTGVDFLALGEVKSGGGTHVPNAVYRVNAVTGVTKRVYPQTHPVSSLLLLKGDKEAILGGEEGHLTLLNLETGASSVLPVKTGGMVTALAVNAAGTHLAAGTANGELWSLALAQPHNARHVNNLGDEVGQAAFLEDDSNKVAARVSGDTSTAIFSPSSSTTTNAGVIWDPANGSVTKLPAGAGLAILDERCIALGEQTVSFHDLITQQNFATLGTTVLAIGEDEAQTRKNGTPGPLMGVDFKANILFLGRSEFRFSDMTWKLRVSATGPDISESEDSTRDSPVTRLQLHDDRFVVPGVENSRENWSEGVFQEVMFLGKNHFPALVPLREQNLGGRDDAKGIWSPSRRLALVECSNRFSSEVRLVDVERMKVMSQPGQNGQCENLLDQGFLQHMRLLDDEGHRVLWVKSASSSSWGTVSEDAEEEYSACVVEMVDYAGGTTLSKHLVDGEVDEVLSSPEHRSLFLLTRNQVVHKVVWDDRGILRVAGWLKLNKDGTWYARIPSGEFMASGAEELLALSGATRAMPLETGAPAFHRPHEVAAAFGANSSRVALLKKAWERRTKNQQLQSGADDRVDLATLPRVEVLKRNTLPLATSEGELRFEIQVESPQAPLKTLHVSVNGVPLSSSDFPLMSDRSRWSGNLTVRLSRGKNLVQFSASNVEGRESLRESITIHHTATNVSKSDLYMVVVGVSDYANDELDLVAAAKDAEDVSGFMEQNRRGNFSNVKTLKILDREATYERILAAKTFLASAQIEDQVIVYVAGHGFVDEEGLRYWFGTHDIDVQAVDKRGVSYEELESLFDGVPARQRLLLMDTCFAGEVDMESSATLAMASGVTARAPAVASIIRKPADGSFDLMKEMFSDLRRNTGATVITASSGMEFVFAEERVEGDNGVFTYCLLNGLRSGSADADGDGSIRLSELQAYLLTQVPAMTGGRQRPTGRFLNHDANFVIGTTTARPSFDAKKFVGEYLELTARNGSEQKIASLLAPVVDYFGKSQSTSQIVQAEESYHQRFPHRAFRLVDDSIQTKVMGDSQKRITYSIRYDHSSQSGEIKGGSQNISMDVVLQGGAWKISELRVLNSRPDAPTPLVAVNRTPAPPVQQSPFQQVVTQFLKVSSGNGQEIQFANMFADSVDYFGKRFTRDQIYQDEVSTHRNWPYRRLSLSGPVRQVNVSPNAVVLRYTMSSWQSKTSDGGKTTSHLIEMRLRLINGKWFITAMKVRKQ